MRDILILIGLSLVSLIVGTMIYFLSDGKNIVSRQTATSNQAASIVAFAPIVSGLDSSVTKRKNYLVTSSAQLTELWKMFSSNGTPPAVDFVASNIIAVFAGEKPTAGYTISVSKIKDSDTRMVTVLLSRPDKNCVLTQALTAPYQIIKIPKSTLPLNHTDISTTTPCLNK